MTKRCVLIYGRPPRDEALYVDGDGGCCMIRESTRRGDADVTWSWIGCV